MLNKSAKAIWLASFPKSGNTWLRLFYSALTQKVDLDINNLIVNSIISSRNIVDSELGLYSSQIPQFDLFPHRTQIYKNWINKHFDKEYIMCKVHDACKFNGTVLFPQEITRGVVYILRNPFDMAASMANHFDVSIGNAVTMLCNPDFSLAHKNDKLHNQTPQYLGTWGEHVEGWLDVHEGNLLILKYEDLLSNPIHEFSKFINYLQLNYTQSEIEIAVAKCSFKNIKNKEKLNKFKELQVNGKNKFFRKGLSGEWKKELSKAMVNQIIDCNYNTLLKFGYIDSNSTVLI